MNTFKTTACMLLLTTAGFAVENDGTPPHTPVHTPVHHQHANIVTPIQQALGGLHIGTPVHGIQPQQLFANTPEHVHQQHVQFVTPQNLIQQVTPGTPVALVHGQHDADETEDYDRLVGSVTSSPPLKRRFDETVCGPDGSVMYSTAKKGKVASASAKRSPTAGMERLKADGDIFTPAVHPSIRQFTTGKSMQVGPDVDNQYLTDDESAVSDDDLNTAVQDISMGSFIIHGANPLGNSFDHSVVEDDDEDAITVIDDENSENGDFSDIDGNYGDGYFSGEE